MTAVELAGHRSLVCRDVGFSCEWAVRSDSAAEALERFREHAKCAHGVADMAPDLTERARASLRPAA
jgi:predicted small metal-binding protein